MRSLWFAAPGRLEWRDVPAPRLHGPGEALVRPIAAATCDMDRLIVAGDSPPVDPFAIGHEAVAEVIEVGQAVKGVAPGDTAVVPWHINCGECDRCLRGLPGHCRTSSLPVSQSYGVPFGERQHGGLFDDVVRVPFADGQLVPVPAGADPAELVSAGDALAYGYSVAVTHGNIDGRVLVLGFGGNSLHTVQFAIAFGMGEVVYVDDDAGNRAVAAKLGATAVSGPPEPSLGVFDLVVDASAHRPQWLRPIVEKFMIEPESVIECLGHFNDITLPGFAAYGLGATFHTGIVNSGRYAAGAAKAVAAGTIVPSAIWSDRVAWADLPDAIPHQGGKLVAVR